MNYNYLYKQASFNDDFDYSMVKQASEFNLDAIRSAASGAYNSVVNTVSPAVKTIKDFSNPYIDQAAQGITRFQNTMSEQAQALSAAASPYVEAAKGHAEAISQMAAAHPTELAAAGVLGTGIAAGVGANAYVQSQKPMNKLRAGVANAQASGLSALNRAQASGSNILNRAQTAGKGFANRLKGLAANLH